MGGTAGKEHFKTEFFISYRRLVETKEICCQKSKYAILKLDKIHSAILGICGICRSQGNFVGEKFVFFSKFWCSLKNKEQKKKVFFFLRL